MNKRRQLAAGLVVTIGLITSCGGSDGDPIATDVASSDDVADTAPPSDPEATEPLPTDPPATDPPVTEAPATDPPATDPPATDPPETELPDWASGVTVTVESDTGPLEVPVEVVAFCESSRSFYVAARGLDFLDESQLGAARQLFAALAALAPVTIETAPSPEFAAEPTAARDQLAVIMPAFEEIGYDATRVNELSDAETVIVAVQGFTTTRDSLRTFLVQACGADPDVLDEQARDGAAVAAETMGETIETIEPVPAVEGARVTNSDSTITISVPTDWTETAESVESGRDQLVVSSDIDGFFELTTPGVLVLRGEGGLRDGGFVGRVLDFQADLEEVGCVQLDETDYDDGVYAGQERSFDCGSEGLDVRLLGGTTADETRYAIVLLVHPAAEPGVRQLIVDTFEVR